MKENNSNELSPSPVQSREDNGKEIEIEIKKSNKVTKKLPSFPKAKIESAKPKSNTSSGDEKSTIVFICYIAFMSIFVAFILIEYPIYDAYNLIGPIYDNIKPNTDAITLISDIKEYLSMSAHTLYDENTNTAYNCHTINCSDSEHREGYSKIYHFYNKFNYLIGCRLSSTHYKTTQNSGSFSSSFPYYRSLEPVADFSFEPIINKPTKSDIFIGNVDQQTAESMVSQYLANNIGYNLKTIQIDFMYYNANTQIAGAFLIRFSISKGGLINLASSQMYCFPTALNYKLLQDSKIIAKLVLVILIYVCLLAILATDIKKLVILIKDAVISGKFESHWTLFLELISVLFILITIIYWSFSTIKLSLFRKFELPVTESTYDYYYSTSANTYYLIRGFGISLFLIFIRILTITYQKFPAFDILFMAFSQSISILLCFTVITIVMLLGFSLAANRIFGVNGIKYSTLMSAVMELFKSGIGLSIYNDLFCSDRRMGAVFYLIYVLLFYIIMSKLSISFIIGVYHQKWEANQERVSANARLISLKTKEFLSKLYRLFTCKDPYSTGSKNYCKILRSNINQLNEKGCPYITKEQEDNNMEVARQQILAEKAYEREFLQTKVQGIFIGRNSSNIIQNPIADIKHADFASKTISKKEVPLKDANKDEVISEPAVANLKDSCRVNDKSMYIKQSHANQKLTVDQIKCKYENALTNSSIDVI